MKKLCLFYFLFVVFTVKAQFVNIPDINLKKFLQKEYSSCFNLQGQLDTICAANLQDSILNCVGKKITNFYGLQYFKNLKELNCTNNPVANGILEHLPPNLKKLYCAYCLLTEMKLPNSLKFLDCSKNNLTSLSGLPEQIENVECSANPVIGVTKLPSGLKYLMIVETKITQLPALPSGLVSLYCHSNQLTSLPSLPSNLKILVCYANKISALPNLSKELIYLNVAFNMMPVLPTLNEKLFHLDCRLNKIKDLPQLPQNLKFLDCSDNLIVTLPELPSSLEKLVCSSNLIKKLPDLNENLSWLSCDDNQIENLPNFPIFFGTLHCSKNKIKQLPIFPTVFNDLDCSYNLIEKLPVFENLHQLKCDNNPIDCLPYPLPQNLAYLSFKNTFIKCMPNYTKELTQFTAPLPLCTTTCKPLTTQSSELDLLLDLKIVPNPSHSFFQINMNEAIGNYDLSVSDVAGRNIVQLNHNIGNISVPIEQLENGIYFVSIRATDVRKTLILVKN